MNDPVEAAGRQAYIDGKGERDCPWVDCTEDILSVGFWETAAGRRQRWMRGFRFAWLCNETFMVRGGRSFRPM